MQVRETVEEDQVISVVLQYPNGQRQEKILSGVPREGERIRLTAMDPDSPSLVVEQVMWEEGNGSQLEPQVIVMVRTGPS